MSFVRTRGARQNKSMSCRFPLILMRPFVGRRRECLHAFAGPPEGPGYCVPEVQHAQSSRWEAFLWPRGVEGA